MQFGSRRNSKHTFHHATSWSLPVTRLSRFRFSGAIESSVAGKAFFGKTVAIPTCLRLRGVVVLVNNLCPTFFGHASQSETPHSRIQGKHTDSLSARLSAQRARALAARPPLGSPCLRSTPRCRRSRAKSFLCGWFISFWVSDAAIRVAMRWVLSVQHKAPNNEHKSTAYCDKRRNVDCEIEDWIYHLPSPLVEKHAFNAA